MRVKLMNLTGTPAHHISTMMDSRASQRTISGARESVVKFSSPSMRPRIGGQRWPTKQIHGGRSTTIPLIPAYYAHKLPGVGLTLLTLILGQYLSLGSRARFNFDPGRYGLSNIARSRV